MENLENPDQTSRCKKCSTRYISGPSRKYYRTGEKGRTHTLGTKLNKGRKEIKVKEGEYIFVLW